MKKWVVWMFALVLFGGCSSQKVYETISDEILTPVIGNPMEISIEVPADVTAQVMEGNGTMYLADGYTICVQTLPGGDLPKTLKTVTGFEANRLDVIETVQDDLSRFEAVWTCMGEGGDRVGRVAVLDDGNYHYVVTVLTDAAVTGSVQGVIQPIFRSFRIVQPGSQVSSGS